MESDRSEIREERRIVTAVFVDVVGSTSITEHLDPEDARDVIGGAQQRVIEQIDLLGGTVKDLAGDGVLALFGAPEAHEDDALRAVLAGIRICDAIASYATELPARLGVDDFAVRVGIETGRAALGLHGAGSRQEYGATGDVMNIAARLQSLALPGQVLVGAVTRSMTEDHFLWSVSTSYDLKGKDHPVQASIALRHVPKLHGEVEQESPFVGRAHELRTIRQAIDDAFNGEGSLLALVGDAGIGKSRLVDEARREFTIAGRGEWLEAAAASYASSVPYSLFRDLMLQWLGLPLDATREQIGRATDQRAADLPKKAQAALHLIEEYLPVELDPLARASDVQERTYAAYTDFFSELASLQPVVVVLEDLHWSDSTSIDLARHLAPCTAKYPLVLIVDSRPDQGGLEAVNDLLMAAPGNAYRVLLHPLTRDDDRALLRELLSDVQLQGAIEERILDTTDGNPFFVQEQARSFLHAMSSDATSRNSATVDVGNLVLQPTVERALVARIDTLPSASRQTLLTAAVLGRRFEDALLSAVLESDASEALADLLGERFIRAGPINGTHEFNHALVQEAAYASLARNHRRRLHSRAAAAIERAYRGREAEMAAALGRHYAEADQGERAVSYLRLAATQAASHNAHHETVELAQSALRVAAELSDRGEDVEQSVMVDLVGVLAESLRALSKYDEAINSFNRLLALAEPSDVLGRCQIMATLGQVLCDAHRYDESLAQLDRADELLSTVPPDARTFQVWLDMMLARGSAYYWLSDQGAYAELLNRVRPIVEAQADAAQRIRFYNSVRASLWRRDSYVISDELLELDRELYEAQKESPGEIDRAWAEFHHGLTLMWHRDLDEARPLFTRSLATAERLESTMLRARALTYLMLTARLAGESENAVELVAPVGKAASEVGLPEYEAMAESTSAWLCYLRGEAENARLYAQRALGLWSRLPNRYPLAWLARLPLLAVDAADGDYESARTQAKVMLSLGQQELAEPLATALRAAAAVDVESAGSEISSAFAKVVAIAREHRYL